MNANPTQPEVSPGQRISSGNNLAAGLPAASGGHGGFFLRHAGRVIGACVATAALGLGTLAAETPSPEKTAREDQPPRKVLIATVVGGYAIYQQALEARLQRMDEVVDQAAAIARQNHPGKRLDLVVLPEFFVARPGTALAEQTVRLAEVQTRIAACAKGHDCYIVVPVLLRENTEATRYSNAALLAGRDGTLRGIYRKVHPVAPQGSDSVENGTTPGSEFPVFACDFGRLGIQICFDLEYADGWQALARQGAEIVALPSASPETVRPSFYALQHGFYIVSATPRDHSAFFSPMGKIEAEATREGEVLVHQIDLSYELQHWDAALDEGEALRRKYGERAGYCYYRDEDAGIFWSNDPATTIGTMLRSLGLTNNSANFERIRRLQDKARGGPPVLP